MVHDKFSPMKQQWQCVMGHPGKTGPVCSKHMIPHPSASFLLNLLLLKPSSAKAIFVKYTRMQRSPHPSSLNSTFLQISSLTYTCLQTSLLTLPMLRQFSSITQWCKDFLKSSKPCHVGIHWIALAEYSQMRTHVPGFQSFSMVFCIIDFFPSIILGIPNSKLYFARAFQ